MSIVRFNDEILIVKDSLKIDEVVKRLANLPSKIVANFFKKNRVVLPVVFKREAFLTTLYETALLKVEDKNIKFEDKVLFEALPSLTVFQLTRLLESLDSDLLNIKYKEVLWKLILENLFENDLDEKLFSDFLHLNSNKTSKENIYQYNINLFEIFVDEEDTLEGLTYDKLRLVLYKTVSKESLLDLGKLHGVTISKKASIKEGIEQLLKEAKHSKTYYTEVNDDAIYEQPLAKVYGIQFKEEALRSDLDQKIIKEISVIRDEIKAIKEEIIEMQHLEIILGE